MAARIIQHVGFFLLFIFCLSEKQASEAKRKGEKLNYQDNELFFSSPMNPIKIETTPVEIPIVHQTVPGTTSGGSWCISNPTASETALQVALDYACGYGGADCSAIQPNGACYEPSTVRDHASYAFNDYYQKNPVPTSCVFGGTAQLSYTDPSHGNCRYASATGTITPPTIPTTPPSPTFPITPPSTTTPVIPETPGGGGGGEGEGYGPEPPGSDNGIEPTGTPSGAMSISLNLLLLVAMNYVVYSVAAISYF